MTRKIGPIADSVLGLQTRNGFNYFNETVLRIMPVKARNSMK